MAEKQFDNVKVTVEFEETANRQQVATGDSLPTLFSKVKKFFSDLKTVAFSGSYNDLSDVPVIDDTLSTESTNAIQNKAVAEALQNVDAKTVDTQTLTAPTNAYTPFYPAFVDSNNASATAEALKTNDAYIFQMKGGTTTEEGVAQLILGNTKLAGTDGNMLGRLVFFNNAHSYYSQLSGNANQTGNTTCYLPATGGTLALDLNKAKLTENSEGGNLRLTSPDGTLYMEQDCYNNTLYRCYVVKDETLKYVWAYDSVNNLITFYPDIAPMTLTGNLTFKTANYSSNAFKVTDSGTAYGQLVQVGADGDTIVGAGESVKNLPTAANITGASENLHLCADGSVYIYSNCNTIANRKTFIFNTAGAFVVPTGIGADTSCVRNINAGTAEATTSNCPNGALYGQYS